MALAKTAKTTGAGMGVWVYGRAGCAGGGIGAGLGVLNKAKFKTTAGVYAILGA